ncbi:ATP-dependent zinc metalloprotease FtsH [Phascolarctobacterium succinatutens]|uniref:ATP-dependent zinc metalloprotease FtsH n=1 Tax=Phascolarctobacterium succinatutens YIT 12067 TaxID=626939 RepID=E8LFP9_9FIRM|nr:ATP-dependent zinc metalloprotease FtsH [Phascolarctobacterium succinatutens]MBP7223810.1 ATP-dependent zinc metalloprotease FtsH [Phascolarctobacterium sp.]EFY04314.1 ATP-dependent metallopeptidase HflB [Phascolarctobacterium succinatutens YIT 12067]MDD7141775.1 ATP-dependent zinc metalloprotease FtsH [Phascolarctobacterium succinatutens]MDY3840295.1 ATP-dependent zinc metalloprotease FtsH [Phascolarctobacterium succinatutens]MEE0357023.1 ATP-dependent zinc metalloprotease FtsH [Phascolarc
MNKFFKNVLFYLLIIMVIIWMFDLYGEKNSKPADISYTSFMQHVQQDEIKQVTIVDNVISGKLKDGKEFSTVAPNDSKLVEKLEAKKVDIKAELPPQPPWWMSILSSILPMLIIVGLWFMLMNQGGAGGGKVMNFGKSRARRYDEEKLKITFKDVAGAEEAKQELEEVVEFLKHPQKYNDLGAKIPKGVLLYGPPGTGKTLLAKAVAGEAGVPFFSISGSDFVEMFVGVGASRVRDLFDQAKKSAPCIVFIDEIDAVGRQRGAGLGGGHDEREQTLNQLLVEMDGFSANEGIIMIAATNRPDILDPALLRPGRFDRQIVVDRPDIKGRTEILKVHVKGKPMGPDVNLDVIAQRTPGFTGADLSNLVNEAALLTARKDKKAINMPEMEEAAERVIMGPERKSRVISDKEKRLTAYHEGGHTIVGMLLEHTDPVHKVTIIPRGRAGGYTLSLPKEDKYYATRSEMLDELKVLLGGRVAEALVLKEISSGASNDLQRATQLARQMICEYGMSENIGPVTFGHRQDQVFLGRDIARDKDYSEEVAAEIDKEVRSFMEDAYAATEKLLSDNIDKLHVIAKALMEKETLEEEEINQLVKYGHILTAEEKLQLVQQSVVDEEIAAAPVADADVKAEAPAAEADVPKSAANADEEAPKE